MITRLCVVFFIIGTVFGADENEAKLRFYHDTFENYTELSFENASSILNTSWYNPEKTTVFFCHGFTGHPNGPAVTPIIKAYLEQGQSNVVLLNWEHLAAARYSTIPSSYILWAIPNAVKLGDVFGETLMGMFEAGMDMNNTHLVGHSLGAQVMGLTGHHLGRKGVLLPWITGLDPAGILFDSRSPQDRLSPSSALFVDVIHTDLNKYGSRRSMGTVDFWPNYRNIGPVVQPGCPYSVGFTFTLDDMCNHNRCWEYLVENMKSPGSILGSHAKSYRAWKNYSKEEKLATVLEVGKFEPNAVPGDYYFVTADNSPFGLGEAGL